MSKVPKRSSKKPKQTDVLEPEVLPPSSGDVNRDRVLRSTTFTRTWNAPFLPPEIMKRYDDVVPDGAARLFKIFEEETKHRREMERDSLNYQGRSLMAGKPYALAYTVAVLAVVAFAIHSNSPWVAVVLGGGMLGTVAFGFFRIFGDDPIFKASEKSEEKNVDAPKV